MDCVSRDYCIIHSSEWYTYRGRVDNVMPLLERFVMLMYELKVDEARKELFTQKGRTTDAIPPTFAALVQHTKRVAYQAGHCWGQSLVPAPALPCPSEYGWVRAPTQVWEPLWTTLPEASKSCWKLLRFGCNIEKRCRENCKYVAANMVYTGLRKC